MGERQTSVPLAKAVSRGTAGGGAGCRATGAGANQRGGEWKSSAHEVLRGRDCGGDRRARIRIEGAWTPTACGSSWSAWADDFAADGTHIWIAAGVTDLRRGFTGLSAVAQTCWKKSRTGHVFVFRGRRRDLIKLLWWMATDSVYSQAFGTRPFHLAAGRRGLGIVEPRAVVDALEGIDWRRPIRPARRLLAV